MRHLYSGLLAALFLLSAAAVPAAQSESQPSQSLILRPAVVPLSGDVGQSVTYPITLQNETDQAMEFSLEAHDVVVRAGERQFVEAGLLRGSIAATAVFQPRSLRIPPRSSGSATVTFTLPENLEHRAVVALFKGTNLVTTGNRKARLSLGSLFTFKISDRISVTSDGLEVQPPTASTTGQIRTRLVNDGAEPSVPNGTAVVLDASGRLVGKVEFAAKRLLPGEAATVVADYPGELPPGSYRAVATFDVGGQPLTQSTAWIVE